MKKLMRRKVKMMNDIVERLKDVSLINTYKLHDLLNTVLEIQYLNFPNNEIKYDPEKAMFFSNIDERHALVVVRDMNIFAVVARVIKDSDTTIAQCVLSISGMFDEKYDRLDPALKMKVCQYFTAIGGIDVSNLMTGPAPVPEENVSTEETSET
jgi:hypothetical protein